MVWTLPIRCCCCTTHTCSSRDWAGLVDPKQTTAIASTSTRSSTTTTITTTTTPFDLEFQKKLLLEFTKDFKVIEVPHQGLIWSDNLAAIIEGEVPGTDSRKLRVWKPS